MRSQVLALALASLLGLTLAAPALLPEVRKRQIECSFGQDGGASDNGDCLSFYESLFSERAAQIESAEKRQFGSGFCPNNDPGNPDCIIVTKERRAAEAEATEKRQDSSDGSSCDLPNGFSGLMYDGYCYDPMMAPFPKRAAKVEATKTEKRQFGACQDEWGMPGNLVDGVCYEVEAAFPKRVAKVEAAEKRHFLGDLCPNGIGSPDCIITFREKRAA